MSIGNKGGNKGAANLKPCKKGETHNPNGRPKIPEDIKKAFKELTPQAIKTIEEILVNEKARPSERLKAAEIVLDRAWGKPIQQTEAIVGLQSGVVLIPEIKEE